MKLYLLIIFPSCLFFLTIKGQSGIKQVQQKILSADSIVLISHVLTAEFAPKIVEDWDATGKRPIKSIPSFPKYLKKGKINPAIIKQRKAISKAETSELSQILKFENAEEINSFRCDWPHHSILIYKKNTLSYIDICFECKHINTSKGILLTEADFTNDKWKKLKSFFKKLGLTYELATTEH